METSGLGRGNITIRDVAMHAGVSIATVSRALSRNRPMSPQLQEKVLASVDALGYRPNLVGRALRQKKTSTIGLIVPDLENPFLLRVDPRSKPPIFQIWHGCPRYQC